MAADKKSNPAQIAQAVLDETNQSVKVSVVNTDAIPVDIQDTEIAIAINKDEDSVTIYTPNNNTTPIPVDITNNSLKVIGTTLDSDWVTIKNYASNTLSSLYNNKPLVGEFIALPGMNDSSQNIQIISFLKTSPAASIQIYLWTNDTDITYYVSNTNANAKSGGSSVLSSDGAFGTLGKFEVNVARYKPGIKFAVSVSLQPVVSTFTVNGSNVANITAPTTYFNPGYLGGELVNLATTGQLPIGLAGYLTNLNTTLNTVDFSGVQFADGEAATINTESLSANAVLPLGLSGLCRASNLDMNNNWFVLDAGYNLDLNVGDEIRFRPGLSSTLPSLAGTALAAGTSYVVTEVLANKFKITPLTHGSCTFDITAPGSGIFYVYKYPYIKVFVKGTNQLSLTAGGPAIDFKNLHDAAPVTVTAGTAATITHNSHGLANGTEIALTAATVPVGSFQGQRFYVRNAGLNTYNLSLTPTGPLVAFTSAGTTVQVVNPATSQVSAVTVAAGTPASIALPTHFLGTGNDFVLGGAALPATYTGQNLYVATALANSFTCSENKLTPCVFGDAGTSVTLTTQPGHIIQDTPIERKTAYIANSPATTDTTVSFSYTAGGPAITLAGGSGTHTFTLGNPLDIKAGSYIVARAL